MFKKVLLMSVIFLFLFLGIAVFLGMTGEPLVDAAAQLGQAQVYVEDGDYEQAEAIYKKIVQDYPATDNALKAQKGLAIVYILWGEQPEADGAVGKLIADFSGHPDIAQAVYDIAYCYGELHKNYEKARDLQQYVLDNWPQSETAIWSQADLAACNISLGDDPNAEAAIEKLLTEFSDHNDIAQAVYDVADHYGGLQQNERARDLYKYALDNWPDSEAAIWSQANLAACNISLGDDPNAEAAIEKLLTEFSGHNDIAQAVYDVADHYGEVNQYEKARELHQYVLENWPQSEYAIWAQMGIAISNIALGDDPNAQVAIEKLLADFSDQPDIAQAVYDVADHYGGLQQNEKARELHQYVLENWPDSEVAIWSQAGLAMSNIALGDDPNAEAAIDSLIADFNDHPGLPKAISDIEEEYYSRILAAEPALSEDYLRPVIVWEKVMQRPPDFFHDDPDLYYFIGDCYRQLGEYEKAIQYYGIVAANWTQNGYAVLSNAVVPRAEDDDAAGDYEALHETIDRLIADFGEHPGLACVVTRSGHGYRRRANDARREGLSTEAETNNFKAIGLYGRVINEFGSSPFAASSYFFSALCYRDLGQWQDALDCCNQLLDNWPDYKDAPWARRLAQGCSERLTTQVQ